MGPRGRWTYSHFVLSRPEDIAPISLYSPPSIATHVLPSRCLRCGAVSREPLCGSCLDYLVSYHPLWLDPALLPAPSLLDLLGPRETAILSTEGDSVEWRSSPREPTAADAVRLVALLGIDGDARPVLSLGDAEILHVLLGLARRGAHIDGEARPALAALYRFLASREWLPPHLAGEYASRARSLEAPPKSTPAEELVVTRVEPESPAPKQGLPATDAGAEPPPEVLSLRTGHVTEEPVPPEAPPPEPVPESLLPEILPPPPPRSDREPEPPASGPEPGAPPAGPSPEPPSTFVAEKAALDLERGEMEEWVRQRSEDLEARERALEERSKSLETKEHAVEEHEKAVTERLVGLERDEARREVLRFLGEVPGMTEQTAGVIATAFPEMGSLEAADVKALTQCKGVTEAQARAVRLALVPGEVEDEQRTRDLREEAQAFMEEGDYRAALEVYTGLVREKPEDTALWFDKAELLVLLDRGEEALQCYTRVLDLDRQNRQAWFERANLLFGMGRLADALDSLREGLRIDASKAGDLILKAEQLRRDGRSNDAAVLLQAILDVDPSNARAVLALGDALMDLGDVDAAEGLFARALGKDPQNPRILFRKGQLLNRKGRWGAAIQFFNRAIALQWNYPGPWLAKGDLLLLHGRPSEALECYEKVLSFDAESVEAWAGRAQCLHSAGDESGAKEALGRAEGLAWDHDRVRAVREILVAAAEKPAGPVLESPAEPDLLGALRSLEDAAEGEAGSGPREEALPADFKSFVEAVEPEKEDVHVLLQLAELALEGGDPQMALVRYGEALEREPRSPEAWTGKGVALQHLERYREALEAYDRALEARPDDEMARKWRETCLRHLNKEGPG